MKLQKKWPLCEEECLSRGSETTDGRGTGSESGHGKTVLVAFHCPKNEIFHHVVLAVHVLQAGLEHAIHEDFSQFISTHLNSFGLSTSIEETLKRELISLRAFSTQRIFSKGDSTRPIERRMSEGTL